MNEKENSMELFGDLEDEMSIFLQKAIKNEKFLNQAKNGLTAAIKMDDGNLLHLTFGITILTPTEEII